MWGAPWFAGLGTVLKLHWPRPRPEPARRPLVPVFCAAVAGILADRFVEVAGAGWIALAAVASAGGLLLLLSHRKPMSRLAPALVLLAVGASSGFWHQSRWNRYRADDVRFMRCSGPVYVDAVVRTSPRAVPAPPHDPLSTVAGEDRTFLVVDIVGIRDGLDWRKASGRARLFVKGRVRDIACRDRVRIVGEMSAPSRDLNPGLVPLSWYDRRERRSCVLFADVGSVQLHARGSPWDPRGWLGRVRDHGHELLERHVSAERAPLASAILLGVREQIDREDAQAYFLTGTVHLLSISGLHVAILAYGLILFGRLGLMRRRLQWPFAALLVGVYALAVDAEPPVVRAAVLFGLYCLSRLFGRPGNAWNTLACAALLVLAANPMSLFQAGTQLSFLAVGTLIWVARHLPAHRPPEDPLDRLIVMTRAWPLRTVGWLWCETVRLLLVSLAVWLVSLPLVTHRFHIVSPVGVPLNPLVCLPIGVAMYAGFGLLLFGGWLPLLGDGLGWLCDRSLALTEWLIESSLRFPGNPVWLPSPPTTWVAVGYALMIAGVFASTERRSLRTVTRIGLAAWLAAGAGWVLGLGRSPSGQLACTFIAVGHGTSVLLEFPDGQTWLYDAGRLGQSHSGARIISNVLWYHGVRRLDGIVVSHADADHYNAVPELLRRFRVQRLYVGPETLSQPSDGVKALREAVLAAKLEVRELHAESPAWLVGDVRCDVLHPPKERVPGNDNANSIVLRLRHGSQTLLLPGDIEELGLTRLLAQSPIDCDLVMAPHHGSRRSRPAEFAAWSTPEHVVVSSGERSDLRVTSRAFESHGARVYVTHRDGAIRVTTRAGRLRVQRWTEEPW